MLLAWMAERLNLGSRGHLAWLRQQRGKSPHAAPANQRRLRRPNLINCYAGTCATLTLLACGHLTNGRQSWRFAAPHLYRAGLEQPQQMISEIAFYSRSNCCMLRG